MNKIFKFIPVLTVIVVLVSSCKSDEDATSKQLNNLKPVIFKVAQPEVISSEPTGNVIDGNKRELLQVVRRQMTLAPVELVDETLSEIIFPGSILRGDAFMEGEYAPVVVKNPQEIKLSASLRGKDLVVSESSFPILSNVRQSINNLLNPHVGEIDYNNAPAYITYRSNEVTTEESFLKTFGIHVKASVLGGMVKAKFNYEHKKYSSNKTHYVLVKVRQQFFNISVDPKSADDWGELTNLGEYEPVYVSSVDYGRVLHILVETTESADSISKMIKGGIEANFGKYSGEVKTELSQKWNKYFKNQKIKIMIAGGPLTTASKVRDYETFMEFIKVPESTSIIGASVPISYRVRSLRNNREVEIRISYTDEELVPEQ